MLTGRHFTCQCVTAQPFICRRRANPRGGGDSCGSSRSAPGRACQVTICDAQGAQRIDKSGRSAPQPGGVTRFVTTPARAIQALRCVPCSAHGQAASKQQKPRLMGGIRFQRLLDRRWMPSGMGVSSDNPDRGSLRTGLRWPQPQAQGHVQGLLPRESTAGLIPAASSAGTGWQLAGQADRAQPPGRRSGDQWRPGSCERGCCETRRFRTTECARLTNPPPRAARVRACGG